MDLSLNNRVIILNSVLPQFDTRSNMVLKVSISKKLALSTEEQKDVVFTSVGNNQFDVSFKTVDAITSVIPFELTDDELMYLKQRIDYIDQNGMFSAETMPTYTKILDAPFQSEVVQEQWNAAHPEN